MHVPDAIRYVGSFVVVLGILVFVHELGHYLAARWRGIYVETFSVGFGRALVSWTDRLGTVWKIAWIPLGGYVKLHGQERPQDVPDEVRAAWRVGHTFQEKSVGSRAIVVAAGPVANFVLASLLFAVLFATAGRPMSTPVIGEVMPDSAAARAGLQPGDRVLAVDDQPVARFEDLRRLVAGLPDKDVALRVLRHGDTIAVTAHTAVQEGALGRRMGVLGVKGGIPDYQRLDPVSAAIAGVGQTWDVIAQTVQGLGQMLVGARSTEELSGPLGIAQLSGQVASQGLSSMLSFIAVLSASLGLINLFPIPVLDGGHLVLYLFEALRGRPLSQRLQEYGFRAGVAVLAGLFVFATWNDLSHLGIFRWVRG